MTPAVHAPTEDALALLRRRTDPLHAAVERATDLPRSLRRPEDVAGLLRRWATLAALLEPRAATHAPSLLPDVVADLALLGAGPPPRPPATVPAGSHAAGLGTAWVLLGARLGLATLAGPVAAVVGTPLRTFARHDVGPLRLVRTELGRLDPDEVDLAATAAVAAFDLAATTLGGPPWTT